MLLKADKTYAKAAAFLIILSILGIALGIFGVFNGISPKEISETEVITIQGKFDHYKYSNSKYSHGTIYLENGRSFDVNSIYSAKCNWKGFEQDIHKGDVLYLKIYSEFKDDINSKPYVLEIATYSATYLSFNDVKKSFLLNDKIGLYVGGGIFVLSVILLIMGIVFAYKQINHLDL